MAKVGIEMEPELGINNKANHIYYQIYKALVA